MENKIIRLNYIGSKHNLYSFIKNSILDFTNWNDLNNKIIGDLFSGTGIITYNLRNDNAITKTNDSEYYSYIISYAFGLCTYDENLKNIISRFNTDVSNNELDIGYITKNYSPYDECERCYFTIENAKRIDTYRRLIEQEPYINPNYKFFLLASLIVCADNVSNIPAVYGCYLKNYKSKSLKVLTLKPIHTNTKIINNTPKVANENILSMSILNENYDCVYLDPPYNQRQYSKNYHVLNMIARYDNHPSIYGKTGLPVNAFVSPFCSKKTFINSINTILNNINSPYIFMSYSSEGLVPINDIIELFKKYGHTKVYSMEYKRFKSFQYNETGNLTEYIIGLKR